MQQQDELAELQSAPPLLHLWIELLEHSAASRSQSDWRLTHASLPDRGTILAKKQESESM
jgi:hypothetical protein